MKTDWGMHVVGVRRRYRSRAPWNVNGDDCVIKRNILDHRLVEGLKVWMGPQSPERVHDEEA
jgi:hypothetical protein